jgi:hypothetical protein
VGATLQNLGGSIVRIKVYDTDRKTVLGTVSRQTTSIGAAKLAGTMAARFTKIDGEWAWVAKDYLGYKA